MKSLQADAFRGHGFSLLVAALPAGPSAHAIPAGVAALRSFIIHAYGHKNEVQLNSQQFVLSSIFMLIIFIKASKDMEQTSGDSRGIAKCRNPLGRQFELVRRKPAGKRSWFAEYQEYTKAKLKFFTLFKRKRLTSNWSGVLIIHIKLL
ncbi:hypothetical protein HU147_14975 [Planomicrobium chinense]|uniref:hypothetical protein n=1 Tax=Planococcus chinensis TaxID=272917 RepID=UPI001CC60477|nr:hypothetical protein [Planococcus chinensis]MBZ5202510.1 hypothetical protein [Planococcus chinensis]